MRVPFTVLLFSTMLQVASAQSPLFTEVTEDVGLDFVHDPGAEGEHLTPEIMGSGGAFLDYDADGDLDIYLIQAGSLTSSAGAAGPPSLGNQLFRQDADGRFTNVTATSGLGDMGYGTGVAVGDIDNDGFVDVFVGNYGRDSLFRNAGGTFEDATESAGVGGSGWSSSAVFCDYDADGLLDLYVARYVVDDPAKRCVTPGGAPDYCDPQSFSYEKDSLFHNEGDGRFRDVSAESGIDSVAAPALGVLCADFTNDGRMDFYVANDGTANLLWENLGGGKFEDQAILMGAAFNGMGRPEASMGVALGDVDTDGDLDLFMTHLAEQTNTLYLNDGGFGFEDASAANGLGALSLSYTGFGTAMFDLDLDGALDIALVNGRVNRPAQAKAEGVGPWGPYAEPNLLLSNDGRGRFSDISGKAGDFAERVEVSRGLVVGDYDRDGDVDMLVTNTAGPARLYRNDAPRVGSWLVVRALDRRLKRDAHGAVVTLVAGGKRYVRTADPCFSYLSSNEPTAHFGVPGVDRYEGIEVRWPDGSSEAFGGGTLGRLVVVEKGAGRRAAK